MKGVVFTEFLQMVEGRCGLETVDRIICDASLPNDGAYTAVGTYDFLELLKLVMLLHDQTGVPVSELVHSFGSFLFTSFAKAYPDIVGGIKSSGALLGAIESIIHVEVGKLYPDAELPTIAYRVLDERTSELTYRSSRPFADLCAGLIEACVDHFDEPTRIVREDLGEQNGCEARFTLLRTDR